LFPCADAALGRAAYFGAQREVVVPLGLSYLQAMLDITKIYFFIFGAITLGGAIQGAMKGSMISLGAGGALAALILAGGFLIATKTNLALILALVGAIGVAGKFIPDFLKKGHALWPAGTLATLSVVSIVLTILAFAKK